MGQEYFFSLEDPSALGGGGLSSLPFEHRMAVQLWFYNHCAVFNRSGAGRRFWWIKREALILSAVRLRGVLCLHGVLEVAGTEGVKCRRLLGIPNG